MSIFATMLRLFIQDMKDHFAGLHMDFIGFITSMLCAIHCSCLPLLLGTMPLVGLEFLENPSMEYGIILLSFLIASTALLKCYTKHHKKPFPLIIVAFGFTLIILGHLLQFGLLEIFFTSGGAIAVSIAHLMNWKCTKRALVN